MLKKLKKKLEEKTTKYAQKDIDELSKILNRPKEGEIVKIANIKIPYYFLAPNKNKLRTRKRYYEKHKYFRSIVVLNNDNLLVNGYITYLLALNMGFEYITIVRER